MATVAEFLVAAICCLFACCRSEPSAVAVVEGRNDYVQQRVQADRRGLNANAHLAAHHAPSWFGDYLRKDNNKKAVQLQWMHNINGISDLTQALQYNDAESGNRMVIVGDVYLRKVPNRIPVMAAQPSKSDSLTLKQWLKLFIMSTKQNEDIGRKCIQLNFHSTNVIEPALQYLTAVRYDLSVPVILHANIETEPHSFRETIDPYIFVSSVSKYLPRSIISVGWSPLTGLMDDQRVQYPLKVNKKYTWRMIFDMLENVYETKQPIIFRCRAHLASNSVPQLLWLINIRVEFYLTLWSFNKDVIDNWEGLASLRKHIPPEKMFNDMSAPHQQDFFDNYDSLQHGIKSDVKPWNRHQWRMIRFVNPFALMSTIVVSDFGVGFFGSPTAFLLSRTVAKPGSTQSVSGKVLFVPKHNYLDVNPSEKTGLSIYLLDSIEDVGSPSITVGIRALIRMDGQIFVENRNIYRHFDAKSRRMIAMPNALPKKSSSQLQEVECYGFTLVDTLTTVQFTVYPTRCSGSDSSMPNSTYQRTVTLEVPAPTSKVGSRYVLVQKTGDETVDCLVEDLYHKNRAAGASGGGAALLYNNFASIQSHHLCLLTFVIVHLLISQSM